MTRVVCDISITTDGYSAGDGQNEQQPFGQADASVFHAWMFDMAHENQVELDAVRTSRAFIIGRNMFGPIRGGWTGDWRGWWGPEPPFHAPVFALTHFTRAPLVMDGGTTFHFVTDGIRAALGQASAVPGEGDVTVAGGATTVNQFLGAGLLDELRLHITPYTLGSGTRSSNSSRPAPPLRSHT